MSTGIVVRKVAPLLVDKWTDPAVVVVSPDMAYAIPVVGGHHGANDLARELAALGIQPVITTATETQGLESVEGIATRFGRHVANRDTTREVNAGILDNRTRVYTVQGPAVVLASPGVSFLSRPGIYTVGLGCRLGVTSDEVVAVVHQALDDSGIMPDEVMIYATTEKKIGETGLVQAVESLGGCLIFLDDETIKAQVPGSPSAAGRIGLPGVAEPAALAVSRKRETCYEKTSVGEGNNCHRTMTWGHLYIVGTGPGSPGQMTGDAVQAIESAEYIIGNSSYLTALAPFLVGKEVIRSSMGKEVERAQQAVDLARDHVVAMVSGGDPGVYGMASIVLEVLERSGSDIDVRVIPGVTAANAAASRVGSPLSGIFV